MFNVSACEFWLLCQSLYRICHYQCVCKHCWRNSFSQGVEWDTSSSLAHWLQSDRALCQGRWPQRALVRRRHLPGLLGIFSMHQVWHEGETGRSVGVTLQTWSLSAPPPLPTQVWCFHLSKYHNFCCTVNNVSIVLLALLCFLNLACFLPDPSMNKCSRNSFLTSSLFRSQRSLILWYCLAGFCKLFNVNGWRLIKIEAKEVWNHWIHIYAKICII